MSESVKNSSCPKSGASTPCRSRASAAMGSASTSTSSSAAATPMRGFFSKTSRGNVLKMTSNAICSCGHVRSMDQRSLWKLRRHSWGCWLRLEMT